VLQCCSCVCVWACVSASAGSGSRAVLPRSAHSCRGHARPLARHAAQPFTSRA
jgi:hypothetical protein